MRPLFLSISRSRQRTRRVQNDSTRSSIPARQAASSIRRSDGPSDWTSKKESPPIRKGLPVRAGSISTIFRCTFPAEQLGLVRGFSDELPLAGLLRMVGFFEHFKITFDPTALCVELER